MLLVTATATLYALVLTFPLALHLSSAIYGYPGDATGTIAVYSWWQYALLHGKSVFDNTAWGAPYGAGWQSVPFTVLPLAILAPLSTIFGSTFAYNLQVLSSFPLTALTAFLLARSLGCRAVSAAFAALSFTFVPYHLEKAQGHVGQAHMEFFPAALLLLLRWHRGRSKWNLVGAGAMAGLMLWTDYYFAFILVFGMAAFFAVIMVHRLLASQVTAALKSTLVAAAIVAISASAFVPVAVYAAARPGSGGVAGAVGAQIAVQAHNLTEIRIYSLRPQEYLLPYHANPLLPSAISRYEQGHLHGSNFVEQSLFIGYTVLILAVVYVLHYWRRFEAQAIMAVGAVGFASALPPTVRLSGIEVPMPSDFIGPLVPFFRVYSRFGVLVLLAAVMLAGLGLSAIEVRLKPTRRWLLAIPFLLVALEFNNIPPLHVTQIFPAPAEYRWLASQPPGILLEYPLKSGPALAQEIETRQYTLYQQTHGHPIFNGATTGSEADLVADQLEPYYGTGVARHIHDLGITYVFVHRTDYLATGYEVPRQVPGLTYVQTIDDVDIYTVD